MATPRPVRQQDIAARAGVHTTTVSMALRNDPRLSEETRKRLRALADEMGYTPDPMLSALTVYRNQSKRTHHQGTLAWLCPPTVKNNRNALFMGYLQGAEQRCAELGYKLEVFYFSELGANRLSSILHARNIKGLLIPPQAHSRAHLDFDWSEFSSICFGFTLNWPRLHLITNAQYSSARMATRTLRERGYRRIGFVTTKETDERTDQNFFAGFLSEQHAFPPDERLPPLVLEDSNITKESKEFYRWFRANKPDAVVHHYDTVSEFFRLLGIRTKDCALASLCLTEPQGKVAGVYQNDPLIGCKAVDFLIDMIHRNERGIPPKRFQFFVESEWVEGETVRPAIEVKIPA